MHEIKYRRGNYSCKNLLKSKNRRNIRSTISLAWLALVYLHT